MLASQHIIFWILHSIFLQGRAKEGGGHWDIHFLFHSSNCQQIGLICVSHIGDRGPSIWTLFCSLRSHIHRELDWKWNTYWLNHHSCGKSTGSSLTQYAIMDALHVIFLKDVIFHLFYCLPERQVYRENDMYIYITSICWSRADPFWSLEPVLFQISHNSAESQSFGLSPTEFSSHSQGDGCKTV